MLQTRHGEFQGSVLGGKRSIRYHVHFRCREACVVDRFGNQDRIEGFSRLWVNYRLTLHQIDISMTNAIQAFQGLFSPFRSKPSYHAVDLDRGLNNLSRGMHRPKKGEQSE